MNPSSLSTLGEHLKKLRLERGVSLSKLAADSNIAKSNLSRIEQGKSNPTLDTLWRLAVQLKVPFGNLVSPLDEPVDDADIQVRLITQGQDTPRVDVYWMQCKANNLRVAEAHTEGVCEAVTVVSGSLEVGALGLAKVLSAGESYQFSADQPHFYKSGDSGASALVVITYTKGDV